MHGLSGVVIVLDVEDGRVVSQRGVEAGPFLAALAGDGTVSGVRIW